MNATITTIVVWLAIVILPVSVTVSVAVMPWIADRREVFGVTVPPTAHWDPGIRALKTTFSRTMACLGLTAVLLPLASWHLLGETGAVSVASVAAIAVIGLGFLMQQRCRRKASAIKTERGWSAEGDRRAVLVDEPDNPEPLGLAWELLHVVALGITVAVGLIGYDRMPARVPMHMDLYGRVDGWSDKTPAVIWFAVVAQLVLALVMAGGHAAIVHSKRPVDPDHPATTSYAYGAFSRAWSVYTLVIGLVTAVVIGLGTQLLIIGVLPPVLFGPIALLVAMAAVLGALIIGLYYGQSGSRVFAHTMENGETGDDAVVGSVAMPYDDDRHWHAGVFYVNRGDPAIWVPKRFGVGWTCNFGRPIVWMGVALLMLVAIGTPVAFAILL